MTTIEFVIVCVASSIMTSLAMLLFFHLPLVDRSYKLRRQLDFYMRENARLIDMSKEDRAHYIGLMESHEKLLRSRQGN